MTYYIRTLLDIPEEIRAAILECPKGEYQSNLLNGTETWSGSSLKGKAKKWLTRYSASRNNLIKRINMAIEPCGYEAYTLLILDETSRRYKRTLVIERPSDI
jgi:hypothetical protein